MQEIDHSPPSLPTFRNQVAGHGSLLYISRKQVFKPGAGSEIQFYLDTASLRSLATTSLSPLPSAAADVTVHSTVHSNNTDIAVAAHSKSSKSSDPNRHAHLLSFTPHFFETRNGGVVLGNLLAAFLSPCMMDLKLGTRLYEDCATDEKKQRMTARAAVSTTGSLGVRVCGIRTTLPPDGSLVACEHGRAYGYSLDAASFHRAFFEFTAHMSLPHARATLAALLVHLEAFRHAFRTSRTDGQFIGTSLLILADSVPSDPPRVSVHWIDFAHSRWSPGLLADASANAKQSQHACNLLGAQDEQMLFGVSKTIEALAHATAVINSVDPPLRFVFPQPDSTSPSPPTTEAATAAKSTSAATLVSAPAAVTVAEKRAESPGGVSHNAATTTL